jgi:hypothetical protein
MANFVNKNYEVTIDFGAHLNPRSIISYLETGEIDEDYFRVALTAVFGRDHWYVSRGLLVCIEAGQEIAFLFSMSVDNHSFARERIADFDAWMTRKCEVADKLNEASSKHEEVPYSAIALPTE